MNLPQWMCLLGKGLSSQWNIAERDPKGSPLLILFSFFSFDTKQRFPFLKIQTSDFYRDKPCEYYFQMRIEALDGACCFLLVHTGNNFVRTVCRT